MNTIYVFVVIYNEEAEKSISCKSLINIPYNFNVILIDNSTIENSNKSYARENKWSYISMEGNYGISKAYNKAIESIYDKEYWAVLLDGDTPIKLEYFNSLEKAIGEKPDVYIKLPIVKDKTSIMSPALIGKYGVKRIREIGEVEDLKKVTGINAGMVINSKVFEKMKYDERYFLDYIDHNFIRDYKRHFDNGIEVIDAIIEQNFSDDDHSNFSKDRTRFNIYVRDFKIFCSQEIFGYFYFLIKVLYRGLKLSILHKNFEFIKIIFRKK